jgi:uncharacterized protein
MAVFQKIINDPVYGFINIDHPLVYQIIQHPSYQRLRRIYQMALAYLVYPGAVHSRLHHSLGAYHLMCNAIAQLSIKGVTITAEEALGAKIAILLHDVGHGPFSHTLEGHIVNNAHHEAISLAIMQQLNTEFDGALETAILIFTNKYPKKFLYQLISGQLDVDRMDYLNRDSFFSGVTEGVIGYDRIIKMLQVVNDNLVVEEKGIHSVENFLIARRLMYEQVYLHKTVLAAEKMLVQIIKRAKYLISLNKLNEQGTLMQFLSNNINTQSPNWLNYYLQLDDFDVLALVKQWQWHDDVILSNLCKWLINRNLPHCSFNNVALTETKRQNILSAIQNSFNCSIEEANWYLITDAITHSTYNFINETIIILKKDSTLVPISNFNNTLLNMDNVKTIEKHFLAYPKNLTL